jgi:hypothetical protein
MEGMRPLLGLNAVLALLVELALLAAGVVIGLASGLPAVAAVVLAVLLPIAVVVVWGSLLAPRAPRRLAPAGRLIAEAVLFGLGVMGLAVVGALGFAVALAIAAGARLALGAAVGAV